MAATTRGATLARAITTCIEPTDDAVAGLGGLFTDDAMVWSPNLMAVGLESLAALLGARETAFTDVTVEFDSLGVLGDKGFAEFRVTATFSGPFVIDDDVVIEPNGRQLLLGAAAMADFVDGKIASLRAYFDDASLLEQMLPA